MKTLKVLGIETSCDETAISIIEVDHDGKKLNVLGNTVHSQIDMHVPYGGVFPILAKREHQKNLIPVLEKTLAEARMLVQKKNVATNTNANTVTEHLVREPKLLQMFTPFISSIEKPDIDLISVTIGPGLEPALWVGINFARALAATWNVPLVPCNHMEGHILAALIKKASTSGNTYNLIGPKFPALSLLISGGHTQIVLIESIGSYKIIGETRDDAIGECFDKVARTLGLAYPGGPKISKLAAEARAEGIASPEPLPRPMIETADLDFSFSGLKTAVLYLTKRITLNEEKIKGICREVEDSITEVVIKKMRRAIEQYAVETLIIGGGVIANNHIRKALEKLAEECSLGLLLPETSHSTDNALMMALAGYFNRNKAVGADVILKAAGTLPLGPRA